jgi:WD40 repeat protein
MKVLPAADQTEIKPFYLDSQTALFLEAHPEAALVCAWSSDSKFLATGSADGTVVVWRLEELENRICVVHHSATILRPGGDDPESPPDITALAWNSTKGILAVGTFSGLVVLYENGGEIARSPAFSGPVINLSFNPKGEQWLLIGVGDGTVSILGREKTEATWKLDAGELASAVWLDSTKALFAVGKSVYLMELGHDPVKIFEAHASITAIGVHPQQELFHVADSGGLVTVHLKGGNLIHSCQIHRSGVCSVSWAEIPDLYVAGGFEGTVKLVHCNEGEPPVTLEGGHTAAVYAIGFDPIGRYIASGDTESVSIWDVASHKLIISYRSVKYAVISLQWSPNGRFLTICLQSGQVALIDFEQIC